MKSCTEAMNSHAVRQTSYEADGAIRYSVDMIADGIAILARSNGKHADN